jgi:transcriptional regulator with XRE-family HTH domain
MDNLSAVIGANLAEIRRKRGLTLDKVSELSGVSKAMVGQIERGESNPTVATLWKVALGLRIPFSELITEKRAPVEIVRCTDIPSVVDDAAGVKIFPLFPFERDRHFEIFLVTLDPSASHASDPHANRSEEYILLIEGAIEIVIGADAFRLDAGDAFRCHADKPHFYRNLADRPVRFLNIIYYGQSGDAPPVAPPRPAPNT